MRRKCACVLAILVMVVSCLGAAQGMQMTSVQAAQESTLRVEDFLDMSELGGWASVAGDGIDGVTGGGKETPQIVTTLEELKKLAGGNVPRVIVVKGRIETGTNAVSIGSNKTIVGMDKDATIYGGIDMNGVSNIIISNLNIEGVWPQGEPVDCVAARDTHHLWLNHLNAWNASDGNVDLTMGSDYLTVSWCKFWYTSAAHEHRLSNLIGSGTGHDDTDMEKLKITYHHNWFAENLDQRMPRILYGQGHVYNNYYTSENNTYCIGVGCYASVLIENNYFKNVNRPHQFMYANALPAYIYAEGNIYDHTKGNQDSGWGGSQFGYVIPFTEPPYSYVLDDADEVPQLVQEKAGPQNVLESSAQPVVSSTPTASASPAVSQTPSVSEQPTASAPVYSPFPTNTPHVNDRPLTYDAATGIYTCHGLNSDWSNGWYDLKNPFAGLNLHEEPFLCPVPFWSKGVSISYWVNVPSTAVDAPILTFNLNDDRQMTSADRVKYDRCQEFSEENSDYSMGTSQTYVDENGKEYQVLKDYGLYVCYNPHYPKEGCYVENSYYGSIPVYAKDEQGNNTTTITYLNYIGEGQYEEYSKRFDEEGGENSLVEEACIDGSLCLYASGSVGFRQDNLTGLQINPHVDSYGHIVPVAIYNQFYYWGNGGTTNLNNSVMKTPVMKAKDQWHFVVAVITNDWVQFYMDGVALDIYYLNYWGKTVYDPHVGGAMFNLGYGQSQSYLTTRKPDEINTKGMTIMDFLSNEKTVMTVGGNPNCAQNLGQDDIYTEEGVQIKGFTYYEGALWSDEIGYDTINSDWEPLPESEDASLPIPSHKPQPSPSPTPSAIPTPSVIPTPSESGAPVLSGDVDQNGKIDLLDASVVLKAALGVVTLEEQQQQLADVNQDTKVTLEDAQTVLKLALGILKGN